MNNDDTHAASEASAHPEWPKRAEMAIAGIDYAMNWKNNRPSAERFAEGLALARQFVLDARFGIPPRHEALSLLSEANAFVIGAANSAYNEVGDPPPHHRAKEAGDLSTRITAFLAFNQAKPN
jgi:hypothetical protein